jgi:hypothetical protein
LAPGRYTERTAVCSFRGVRSFPLRARSTRETTPEQTARRARAGTHACTRRAPDCRPRLRVSTCRAVRLQGEGARRQAPRVAEPVRCSTTCVEFLSDAPTRSKDGRAGAGPLRVGRSARRSGKARGSASGIGMGTAHGNNLLPVPKTRDLSVKPSRSCTNPISLEHVESTQLSRHDGPARGPAKTGLD